MSKYITKFETESAYQTALPTLVLPNVSLVTETNEVHYNRKLWGAVVGDILVYDVAEAQKVIVKYNDWNLTDYPIALYPIIGVVAMDESAIGLKVLSTMYPTINGGQSTSESLFSWQSTSFDWGLTKYSNVTSAVADLNGKFNTTLIIAAIEAYDRSHSTNNITDYVGEIIKKYYTEGTNAGDWYIPSAGELYNINKNKTAINSTLSKLNSASSTIASTTILSGTKLSSTEYTASICFDFNFNNGYLSMYHNKNTNGGVILLANM